MPPTLGFIGLGRMGAPMCANLLAAGHRLVVCDRRPEAGAELRSRGASWAASPREAAAEVEVLITMLPGPAEVEDAMLGPGRGIEGLRAGAAWIDMGTGTPALARRIAPEAARAGVEVLDAPVGGGVAAAGDGTLAVFAGGDADLLERRRPLLAAVADPERLRHAGPYGSGYTTKLLVNLVWFGQALITAEAMLVAARAGLDLDGFRRTLATSSATSAFVREDAARLLAGDYLTSFGLKGCVEELEAILGHAREHSLELPVAPEVERSYRRALERYGDLDGELLAVRLLEDVNGVALRGGPDQAASSASSAP
jgi:3-hydroxyisobutyrate dehydrogenase